MNQTALSAWETSMTHARSASVQWKQLRNKQVNSGRSNVAIPKYNSALLRTSVSET